MELSRRIHAMIEPYRHLDLDANGMTKVISRLLRQANILHGAYIGTISLHEEAEQIPHAWIQLATGQIVDLRARAWFPDGPPVPEGVFHPGASPLSYEGVEVFLSVSKVLFDVLTKPPSHARSIEISRPS